MDFLDTGNPFALAPVVRVRGAASRHSGARMLVFPDGRTEGTVGGATLEQRVIQHALEALKVRKTQVRDLSVQHKARRQGQERGALRW